jgi:hypothetical protein
MRRATRQGPGRLVSQAHDLAISLPRTKWGVVLMVFCRFKEKFLTEDNQGNKDLGRFSTGAKRDNRDPPGPEKISPFPSPACDVSEFPSVRVCSVPFEPLCG